MCQLWALHVVTKRQFFYIYANDLGEIQTGSPPTVAPNRDGVG